MYWAHLCPEGGAREKKPLMIPHTIKLVPEADISCISAGVQVELGWTLFKRLWV